MEFLSLSRRRSSARNVLSDEERGETDVFAGYILIVFLNERARECAKSTRVQILWRLSYVSDRTPIKCPQLHARYVWSPFWQRLQLISKGSLSAWPLVFVVFRHRRTGNFLPGGAVNHLPKKISPVAQIFRKSRKEMRVVLQQQRPSWHMKVARYGFSGSIPSLSINYVAINKNLEKLRPQLY